MRISAYVSPDTRLRTNSYKANDYECFSIAEKLASGTLVTEFKTTGEVVNQTYIKAEDTKSAILEYLGGQVAVEFSEVEAYTPVKVDAKCSKCGADNTIDRALDRQNLSGTTKVPIVPMFVCRKCGTQFYSMTDSYLKRLIENNVSLFEKEEIEQKEVDEAAFVNELQEYIIRIFASKKIHKLNFRG
jgi:hypothetical protein